MSLTLYGAPLSPFVRKVRLLLAEKGLDYQLEAIAPFGQPAWYREEGLKALDADDLWKKKNVYD